ncbi:MAG: rfbF [Bacteriovoracaceae bacterium]|nr:rfbF [Bacteriovoracaceae bacterium]
MNLSEIPVAILCGGKGTRLREETEFRPKPMIRIGSKPILWHIMKHFAHYGVRNFMLCLGYKGELIREYFLNYDTYNSDILVELGTKSIQKLRETHDEKDWRVSLIDTGQNTATGGRLKILTPYIQNKYPFFFATYGDGVGNINIDALAEFHLKQGKLATVTAVRPPSRFGELSIENDLAKHFHEKSQTYEGWINGGFLVLDRKVLDLIDDEDTALELSPMRALAAQGQLAVYRHEGFWQCMDTHREMELLNDLDEIGEAPWKVWINDR